jgi:hypothetical protein
VSVVETWEAGVPRSAEDQVRINPSQGPGSAMKRAGGPREPPQAVGLAHQGLATVPAEGREVLPGEVPVTVQAVEMAPVEAAVREAPAAVVVTAAAEVEAAAADAD